MALDPISLVLLGIVAFAATNIDDIFLLMMFFSSPSLQARHVVIGQYLGLGLLVAISAVASLLSLVVPSRIIGLLGLVPILIGIKKYFELRTLPKGDGIQALQIKKRTGPYLSVSRVASVTFTDGSDNIGVYVPLFASHSSSIEIVTLVLAFLGMTAVWSILGHYVVKRSFLASPLQRLGHLVFPFVLIAIGISVLVGAFS